MSETNMAGMVSRVLMFYVPFLFALCFHEFAHGWVARRKGDRTAEVMGRLTMNPMAHIDIVGTVVLPIMALAFQLPFFGWAKPVPVNERNLKKPKADMFWVALAGPLSNILLAFIATLALVFLDRVSPGVNLRQGAIELLKTFLLTNLFLAVFNLIPLHPLDGGKVLARFLPDRLNASIEANQQMTMMILIGLMISGAFHYLAIPVYMLADVLFFAAGGLAHLI
jgi:Zn-dependent protease